VREGEHFIAFLSFIDPRMMTKMMMMMMMMMTMMIAIQMSRLFLCVVLLDRRLNGTMGRSRMSSCSKSKKRWCWRWEVAR